MSDEKKVPRTFMGKGYVVLLEKGLYGLYRDVLVQEGDVREKAGSIGPIKLLREAQKGEEALIVLRTSHPNDPGKIIELVETT